MNCYRVDDVRKGIVVIKVYFCNPLLDLPEILDQILASVCSPPMQNEICAARPVDM